MNHPFLSQILVELHVPDFQVSYDFYKLLGFELGWMEETYMVLVHDQQALCFYGDTPAVTGHSHFSKFPAETPRGYGVEIVIFTTTIDAVYAKFKNSINLVAPLRERPWGAIDFRIVDPFGFYLRISTPYDTVTRADRRDATELALERKRFRL